jgi:hypothetical protein
VERSLILIPIPFNGHTVWVKAKCEKSGLNIGPLHDRQHKIGGNNVHEVENDASKNRTLNRKVDEETKTKNGKMTTIMRYFCSFFYLALYCD